MRKRTANKRNIFQACETQVGDELTATTHQTLVFFAEDSRADALPCHSDLLQSPSRWDARRPECTSSVRAIRCYSSMMLILVRHQLQLRSGTWLPPAARPFARPRAAVRNEARAPANRSICSFIASLRYIMSAP